MRSGNKKGLTFDTNTTNLTDSFTPLHYSCSGPSLNMINDLLSDPSTNPFALDSKLKTPHFYVPKQYLTSKKLIQKYEKDTLRDFFSDPSGFKISLLNTKNQGNMEDYIDDWNEQLQDEPGIGMERKGQIIRYSDKKFIKHFNSSYYKSKISNDDSLQLRSSNRTNRKTKMVPKSLEIKKYLPNSEFSEDVSEDVTVGKMPTSKIGINSRSRRSSASGLSRKPGFSPVIQRNFDMMAKSSKENEDKITCLNKILVLTSEKLKQNYKKLAGKLKSRTRNQTIIMDSFKKFWKKIFKILKILSLYDEIIGVSVNFGEGSQIFEKIDTTVKYIGCSLELLILERDKSSDFNYTWRTVLTNYRLFLQRISKIISFRHIILKSLKIKINNIKICYEQENGNFSSKDILNNKLEYLLSMLDLNFSTVAKKKKERRSSFSNLRHSLNLEKTRQRLSKPFDNSADKGPYEMSQRRGNISNLDDLRKNYKSIKP